MLVAAPRTRRRQGRPRWRPALPRRGRTAGLLGGALLSLTGALLPPAGSLIGPTAASADPAGISVGGAGGTIYYGVLGGQPASSAPGSSGTGSGSPIGAGNVVYFALVPSLQGAGSGSCLALQEVGYASESEASSASASYPEE